MLGYVVHRPNIIHVIVVQEHLHVCMNILIKLSSRNIAAVFIKELIDDFFHLIRAFFPVYKGIFVNEPSGDRYYAEGVCYCLFCGNHGCSKLIIEIIH